MSCGFGEDLLRDWTQRASPFQVFHTVAVQPIVFAVVVVVCVVVCVCFVFKAIIFGLVWQGVFRVRRELTSSVQNNNKKQTKTHIKNGRYLGKKKKKKRIRKKGKKKKDNTYTDAVNKTNMVLF